MENWNIHDAEKLYRINDWGNGYFHISETGEVEVRLKDKSPQSSISLLSIAKGLQERGLKLPVLLRFSNILDDRIQHINESSCMPFRMPATKEPTAGFIRSRSTVLSSLSI